jgi:hypothetical protein
MVYLHDPAQNTLVGFAQMGQRPRENFTNHVIPLSSAPVHRENLYAKQPWIRKSTPELPGDQVAREMRRMDPHLATVLITGWELQKNDPRQSVFDFHIQKPFGNLERVLNAVAQAIELHDARAEERE